ncbi:hypothetical protein GCM10023189_10020 [Nibrella saemangeumensis]|uniref:histidine kinase n=1 Tax=Nibrella saemangeumensis TaxID=1084526 RepID=A0ABP8MII2_9BACT
MRFFYVLILLPFISLAQPKGWQELTISDGLSQGMVFDLRQDRHGFIWIGTKDGLNRYDGYNFKVFTHDPYNAYSLSENSCSALLIDRHQRLWVGTSNKGLNLFDDRSQRFYHIDISDQLASSDSNYEITLLAEDPDGNIWVGTDENKLFRVTLPDSWREHFPRDPDITRQVQIRYVSLVDAGVAKNRLTHYLNFHSDGSALVGTTNGVFSINWRHPANAKRLLFAAEFLDLHAVYEDSRQGYRFASGSDKIIGWYQGKQKPIALPEQKNFSVRIKAIDTQTVAVATPHFLWLMSPAELFRQDSLTIRNAYSVIPSGVYTVTSILKDRTGNLWLGTSGYGLRKFNPKVKQFRVYLPGTTLSSLYTDQQGRTYIRYQFAYAQLDRATNRMVPFLSNTLPEADRRQRYLIQDRQGIFWVSNVHFETNEQHLFKFSTNWQLLKKYPLPGGSRFGFYGNQTIVDRDGNLWIGATNGHLLRFKPEQETFEVFSYKAILPLGGADVETYALYQDRQETFWLGTQKGLIKVVNPRTKPAFTIYRNSKSDRRSLSNDFVLSVIDDPHQPDRYLWIGTKGGGLERLNKQTGEFDHFTEAHGLPNKVVYGILVDERNNLWMSTNRGLAQLNPKTLTFQAYTKADGLQDDEFNTASYFKSSAGELLFGGVNGLTAFRVRDITGSNQNKPAAIIIGLKVNNKPVEVGQANNLLNTGIEYTRTLNLAYNQNLLTFEFGVMDFANPAKNHYRYRLKGVDDEWIDAGTNRFANYAQLDPGDYTLQMSGSADGGVWSNPVELQIRIHPPFYRTWWAYLVYMLVLSVSGWQLYRFQMQRLLLQQQVVYEQKEAGRLAELDKLKTQFFANISHEFRTPLTLILGPMEQIVQEYAQDKRFPLIQRNANRLLSLINQILDLNKLEAGQLRSEPERGDLAAFCQTVAGSFASLAESRQIQFTFTQNEPAIWAEFDRDKLEKIITNLLSNALKFTLSGNQVRMAVYYPPAGSPGMMQVTVEDTGIGMANQHLVHIFDRFYQINGEVSRYYEGTGIGLALTSELVKVLGGTIQASSAEGVGTIFTVSLPIEWSQTDLQPTPPPVSAFPESVLFQAPPAAGPAPVPATENIMLIIDDNADMRAYIRSIFEADYRVVEAEDGQAGLATATDSLPDIIICDLMMPRLDGFGFCKALKTQEVTSHIPVVMLTAKAAVEDRIEGFGLGADDYLTKPFHQAELQARVRNLIEQRRRLYQRFAVKVPEAVSVPEPAGPVRLAAEQQFLDRLTAAVLAHLDNADFSVENLAESVNLSRVQLHRKLKALTNTTATDFIRYIRLAKAAEFLRTGNQSVTQVAYAVGFANLSYFAKMFQEQYGKLPSEYARATASSG